MLKSLEVKYIGKVHDTLLENILKRLFHLPALATRLGELLSRP